MTATPGSHDLFTAPTAGGTVVSVLVTSPVARTYDYLLPEGLKAEFGTYVLVPLGSRQVVGCVWEADPQSKPIAPARLKTILQVYDLPPLRDVQREFIRRVATYTMNDPGSILKMTIPVAQALEVAVPVSGYVLDDFSHNHQIPPHPALSPEGRGFLKEIVSSPSPLRGEGRGEGCAHRIRKPSPHMIRRARELRQRQTDVEQKMWFLLRDRRLNEVKFKRQKPIGPYVVDFICPEKNLIIELDGGQHTDDSVRDARLAALGYKILRFWNNEVIENGEGVVQRIVEELVSFQNFQEPPHPALSPEGRGFLKETASTPSPLRGEGRGEGRSPSHQSVIDLLQDGLPRRLSEITKAAGVGASVVKTLVRRGTLKTVDLYARAPCGRPRLESLHRLTPAQQEAAVILKKAVDKADYQGFLLDGVTGSGKTEVYFEAVAEALRDGRQALILLPEIALSNSFIGRFRERFGCAPALWHSSLSPAQRRLTWRGIATGETKVVVGARSALFLPYRALGVIVIDEEHDPAFKQEDGVLYHARDMAVLRAHLEKIPAILVSATPSLETMHNAWSGRYAHLHLPDRFGSAGQPDIRIIDLKVDKPERQRFISPVLRDAVAETLAHGEQSLLFLNRRGYAPLTLCRTCGHRLECPRCTAWLVEHKKSGKLQCHHCGFSTSIPSHCPSCKDENSLAVCGPGVERIAEEVGDLFPSARPLILASDVTDTHEKLKAALASIQKGEVDIIIGTQIIAKGHHFPLLTCVGVIDADLGLSGGDLRASERTFQLLHQVAGRAGREERKGTVYLQTWMPEHNVMKLLACDDRDGFLRAEAQERERAKMPPFSRLAGIILSGKNEEAVRKAARTLGQTAPQGQGIRTLGPAPAQMYRIRGNYRQRLLLQADKTVNLQKLIGEWLSPVKLPSTIRVTVDIDPQCFL